MAKFCTKCGRAIRPEDSFCLGCGKPVDQGNAPAGGFGGPASTVTASASLPSFDSAPLAPFGQDTESDMAATEVWQVTTERASGMAGSFAAEAPVGDLQFGLGELSTLPELPPEKPVDGRSPLSGSSFAARSAFEEAAAPLDPLVADDGDYDESPTIVAQPVSEDDDEEESPTIVVARERYVLVRDSDGQRTELSLPCILGRGKAADKRVKGNLAISRKHAKVFREDELIMIQDQGSTNGTFVNGLELEGDQVAPVSGGTAIRLGTEDFTFHVESI